MLLTFANSLDPDQDWHFGGPDLSFQSDKMSFLIWIRNVWHSVSVLKELKWKGEIFYITHSGVLVDVYSIYLEDL